VLAATSGPVTVADARDFFASLGDGQAMMLKAVAGGGGRGSRAVYDLADVEETLTRCQSEAKAAFGIGEVYAEQLIRRARHVEVQVAGDGSGDVVHFWERDCSVQRRYQKIVEIAPAPSLPESVRDSLLTAATRMAAAAAYRSLGTFEFLVDVDSLESQPRFAFIETNPRLQVEHTITEEILGVDLVRLQLEMAMGKSLRDLGIGQETIPAPNGFAIQARVNMETMQPDGTTRPAGGTIATFETPGGPGVRTDTFGYAGYKTSPSFDSLLAKVIVHAPGGSLSEAAAKCYSALGEFHVEGVRTNIPFLQNVLQRPEFKEAKLHTRFVDDTIAELAATDGAVHPSYYFPPATSTSTTQATRTAGARVDARDPLAVLTHGKSGASAPRGPEPAVPRAPDDSPEAPEGNLTVAAPMQGTIVKLEASEGDLVRAGQLLLIMEAMKMEHEIVAPSSGSVTGINVAAGDTVYEDHALLFIEPAEVEGGEVATLTEMDLDFIRPDLALIHERHAATLDENRPDAVERRRKTNQRTARENVNDLCDEGSFVEHGSLVLTPGTGLPIEEVIKRFPTDGMITGVGTINGDLFPEPDNRCVVMSYDYTVLAGTQGAINHPKTDRMLLLAEKWRLPVVFFTEGGGGRAGTGGQRPGGTEVVDRRDGPYRPLDTPTFATMGRLSGHVPLVGITSGRCFAGNAALLGCCDVIIATANSNIGMGGPAMVEGGNLGVFTPEEIGPMDIQVPNGVVDIAVEDEAEAVKAARQYLSYFQGAVADWEAPDQRILRTIVPENRLRIYDVRKVIETIADTGSVLELRRGFGHGMVTALARIEGRPIGIIANNPAHLAGAIDSPGSDKAARFMQLCDAFDIPILVLCDTPGMMVGPEVEKTALVRHCSRLFVTGANLTVPHVTIVLRKAYGLGAQAMAGGSFKEPFSAVAWPTGEFGGMGLEGQVKLGYRNELAAMEDPEARLKRYEELVAAAYARRKAIHQGTSFGVDDVIDPVDSRQWILSALKSVRFSPMPRDQRTERKRRNVDTW
jgi:acetyl-CoA carboxylase carboxyltransferase component/acetyl/propionyl-CoA carboxylase alpha subunit